MKKNENNKEIFVELIITPDCNQACSYCYLQKHKDELNPPETRNKEKIVENLHIILQHFIDEKLVLNRLDLFSGEIWGYPFGNKILDIILEYVKKGLQIRMISIPTNGSFAFSQDLADILSSYFVKYSIYNCKLNFSISYDGIALDNINRASLNKIDKNQQYLKILTDFMRKNEAGFHPMISFYGIENQIENYKSWIELLHTYFDYHDQKNNYGRVMQLETREHGWTDEKINEYLKWLKFLIDTDIKEYYDNDISTFGKVVSNKMTYERYLLNQGMTNPLIWNAYFPYFVGGSGSFLGCNYGASLNIRLGDLAIVPCHRTSYPNFILGHYKIKDNKIDGIECQNLPLTSASYVSSFKLKPICNTCALNNVCLRYCVGANYEQNQELFYPEEDNCKLQKAKTIFLYLYYKKLGFEIGLLNTAYRKLKETEPEVVSKWSIIIR